MTIITKKLLHIDPKMGDTVWVDFEWFETNKRIHHKVAKDGKKIRLRLLNENPNFKQHEVLYQEDNKNYRVNILPCECLVIVPKNNFEIASVCYEIGNKHLPLFYQDNALLVPFEKPLFKQFLTMGFEIFKAKRTLSNALKTTVIPHGESNTLFSKIMNLTQNKSTK